MLHLRHSPTDTWCFWNALKTVLIGTFIVLTACQSPTKQTDLDSSPKERVLIKVYGEAYASDDTKLALLQARQTAEVNAKRNLLEIFSPRKIDRSASSEISDLNYRLSQSTFSGSLPGLNVSFINNTSTRKVIAEVSFLIEL